MWSLRDPVEYNQKAQPTRALTSTMHDFFQVKSKTRCLLFIFGALLCNDSFAYFKCTNAEGAITFQSLPCPATSSEEEKRSVDDIASTPGNPNSERLRIGVLSFVSSYESDTASIIVNRSRFASALSELAPVRMLVATYYIEHGQWPDSVSAIGLRSEEMHGRSIDATNIGAHGEIIAQLDNELGNQKLLILRPELALSGTSIEWQCFANFTSEFLSPSGGEICQSREISF